MITKMIDPDLCDLSVSAYLKENGPWCFTYSKLYCIRKYKTVDKFNITLEYEPGNIASASDIDYYMAKDDFVPCIPMDDVVKYLRIHDGVLVLPKYSLGMWGYDIVKTSGGGSEKTKGPEWYESYEEAMNSALRNVFSI